MKSIKNYFLYTAVLMLLITGCSKEETGAINDPAQNLNTVDLTFGAVLNDLTNRAMSRDHLSDIPDCSEADPVIAWIDYSYGGNDYTTTVGVLHDEDGWFTDYSEDLKIPVPNNGSVEVTLNGFKVYDGADSGDPEDPFYDEEYGNLIWAAPVATEEADFAGYVDTALPITFDVEDGTKPYIDVEVLCFDRRMANEYGYVFFNILPDTVYPLCLFLNYCNEDGRHYVANYSVDLYYGTGTNGIQLYNHMDETQTTSPQIGDYNANNEMDPLYYADPLCLTIPGPPENLPNDEPYLYLVIYPEDWEDNYGTADDTPIPVPISWEMIQAVYNADGNDETTDPLHLLIGECEDAINGDGGGNGGNGCDLMNPNADCDNDDVLNKCDTDNPNWATFDCDGDGIVNGQDDCPEVDPITDVNGDGCEDEPVECDVDIDQDGICDDVDTTLPCSQATAEENAVIDFQGETNTIALIDGVQVGTLLYSLNTGSGDVDLNFGLLSGAAAVSDINAYYWVFTQGNLEYSVGPETQPFPGSFGDNEAISVDLAAEGFDLDAAIQLSGYIYYCDEQ